jgi:hypothetical protein
MHKSCTALTSIIILSGVISSHNNDTRDYLRERTGVSLRNIGKTYAQHAIAQHIPTSAIATVACGQRPPAMQSRTCTTVVMKKVDIMINPNRTNPAVQIFLSMKGTAISSVHTSFLTPGKFQRLSVPRCFSLPFADHVSDPVQFLVLVFIPLFRFQQATIASIQVW